MNDDLLGLAGLSETERTRPASQRAPISRYGTEEGPLDGNHRPSGAAVAAARMALVQHATRCEHGAVRSVRAGVDSENLLSSALFLGEGLARKARARDLLMATIEAVQSLARSNREALPLEEDDACCKECPVCAIRRSVRSGHPVADETLSGIPRTRSIGQANTMPEPALC